MRITLAAALALLATPALAQFPPPGIYACTGETAGGMGIISMLIAGDYQWQTPAGTGDGQVASAGNTVEALTGPLADRHWKGIFSTDAGKTVFVFTTDDGKVTCAAPE
ncbi:MAG: hypothetical protein ABI398_05795 [Devosia sp.]